MVLPKKETLVFFFLYTFIFLLNGYQLLPRAVWGPFQLATYVLLALLVLQRVGRQARMDCSAQVEVLSYSAFWLCLGNML